MVTPWSTSATSCSQTAACRGTVWQREASWLARSTPSCRSFTILDQRLSFNFSTSMEQASTEAASGICTLRMWTGSTNPGMLLWGMCLACLGLHTDTWKVYQAVPTQRHCYPVGLLSLLTRSRLPSPRNTVSDTWLAWQKVTVELCWDGPWRRSAMSV